MILVFVGAMLIVSSHAAGGLRTGGVQVALDDHQKGAHDHDHAKHPHHGHKHGAGGKDSSEKSHARGKRELQ